MQPRIELYDFGYIVIDGEEYDRDLIIVPSRGVVENWWRVEGHRVSIEDVRDYLLEDADIVIFGTGYSGMVSVDRDVVELFRSRGLDVLVMDSRSAVDRYNEEVSKGKKVLLFIHLTC